MFGMILCDSLLRAHKGFGVKLHNLMDGDDMFQTCLCIASGGSLVMPGGDHCAYSAVGLAMTALISEPVVRHCVSHDPAVRIVVVNAERSTTLCRVKEQYPMIVKDRGASPLVKSLETPWTICDLEDVVTQQDGRRLFPALEPCKLRSSRGIYGQKGDDIHFRKDVALAAGDELIKACRRTAVERYGDDLGYGNMLLILAAGWNSNGSSYSTLDDDGSAWRKVEVVALAELCALNGHPLSAVQAKMTELLARADEPHYPFLVRRVEDIVPISAPPPPDRGPERQGHAAAPSRCPGHLEGWVRGQGWMSAAAEVGGEADERRKRKRDAETLAEEMDLPADTAESILESAGSLQAALELPMFQDVPRGKRRRELSPASASEEAIDLDEQDRHHQPVEPAASVAAAPDEPLQQLVGMGFTAEQAQVALDTTGRDLARAIDILLAQ